MYAFDDSSLTVQRTAHSFAGNCDRFIPFVCYLKIVCIT